MHETLPTVRFSVWLYRRLLVAYPPAFRRRYGAQMVQVFRDCCRESTAMGGTVGLLRYWLIAFADLVVSALAERRREELHMTRMFWIRLGSLAAIIGSIIPAVLMAIFLVQLLAPQIPFRLDLSAEVGWVFTAQRAFYVLALIALWIHGANRTGVFGWAAIALALAGAIIAVVSNILFMRALFYDASQLLLYSDVVSCVTMRMIHGCSFEFT